MEFDKHKITNPFQDYEKLKNFLDVKKQTMFKYVREILTNNNIAEQSNGESAVMFWGKNKRDSIYILDESENNLLKSQLDFIIFNLLFSPIHNFY